MVTGCTLHNMKGTYPSSHSTCVLYNVDVLLVQLPLHHCILVGHQDGLGDPADRARLGLGVVLEHERDVAGGVRVAGLGRLDSADALVGQG